MPLKRIIIFIGNFLIISKLIGQTNDDRSDNFFLTKIGAGSISYVSGFRFGTGAGLNFEYGKKMYSCYLALGYSAKASKYGLDLPQSYNIGVGGRKYFKKIGNYFRPRATLHIGWLTNYDDSRIITSYNPIVYGIMSAGGFEIYTKYFFIDSDINFLPFIIFEKKNHPYFSYSTAPLYYSLGIGINLISFQNKNKKTKKDEKATPQFQ